MFIRWKQIGHEKYAYLETRFRNHDGKICARSRYLGKNPVAALQRFVDSGELSVEQIKIILSHHNSLPENELCANCSMNMVVIMEIIGKHWRASKNNELALTAREIIMAAGKLEEYRQFWKLAAEYKGGVFRKWLKLTKDLEKIYACGVADDKTKRALEIMEGNIILAELNKKYIH